MNKWRASPVNAHKQRNIDNVRYDLVAFISYDRARRFDTIVE